MLTLFTGSLILSILHALIPSHWLPLIAFKRKFGWTNLETLQVAFWAAVAHSFGTIALGVVVATLSMTLSHHVRDFSEYVLPVVLIVMGIFFMWQHHHHHHFHLEENQLEAAAQKRKIVGMVILLMFCSPCLEIEAYYAMAGAYGWSVVLAISVMYLTVSVLGILAWVSLAMHSMQKLNWHRWDHNSGLISGGILIVTGILSFFVGV